MQHVWSALSGGSTHQTVYMPAFEQLQIIVPPLVEQNRIADIMEAHDAAAFHANAQRKRLASVKAGLLQDLLTGKVRVTP